MGKAFSYIEFFLASKVLHIIQNPQTSIAYLGAPESMGESIEGIISLNTTANLGLFVKQQAGHSYFEYWCAAQSLEYIPVLYTVGLQATFWSMNSSAWAVWAAQAVRKKKSGFELF